jgi:hypothetical protein
MLRGSREVLKKLRRNEFIRRMHSLQEAVRIYPGMTDARCVAASGFRESAQGYLMEIGETVLPVASPGSPRL